MDVFRFLDSQMAVGFDVVFADPPYRENYARRLAEHWLASPFSAVIGIEHESGADMPPGGDTRRYGDSAVTFYRRQPTD
jgi:16S rRNA (guanine966-N2)-methyltransferase